MRRHRAIALAIALLAVAVRATTAQQVAIEADQRYLVIEVVKLDTFEKEVNSAAGQGFRLMMSATSDNGGRIQALMERVATPPAVYQYRMVATFSEKTGDKEMNTAAGDGFRVVPHTAMLKKGLTIFNVNHVVVMEKTPNAPDLFEYRSVSAVRTATFHKELKDAVAEGWTIVDTTYGRVLLERKAK